MDAVAADGEVVCLAVSEHVENAGVHSGKKNPTFRENTSLINLWSRIDSREYWVSILVRDGAKKKLILGNKREGHVNLKREVTIQGLDIIIFQMEQSL